MKWLRFLAFLLLLFDAVLTAAKRADSKSLQNVGSAIYMEDFVFGVDGHMGYDFIY
jgi:hypothetical protein